MRKIIGVMVVGGVDVAKSDGREGAKCEVNAGDDRPLGHYLPNQRTGYDERQQDNSAEPQWHALSFTVGRRENN